MVESFRPALIPLGLPEPIQKYINILINKWIYCIMDRRSSEAQSLRDRLQDKTERLFADVMEVLRLKLRILFSLMNYLEISLYLARIFLYSSLFFSITTLFNCNNFLGTQHSILGPVLSMLVMSLMFSLNSSSELRKASLILNLCFRVVWDLELIVFWRMGLGLTLGNFLVYILGPVV